MTLSDRQAAASRQGRAVHEMARTWLRINGYRIVAEHWTIPVVLVEVDLVIHSEDTGQVWVEVTGSWESTRNGLQRTDTMLKKIGWATIIGDQLPNHPPLWLATSHLPRQGAAAAWMRTARPLFDQIIDLGGGAP